MQAQNILLQAYSVILVSIIIYLYVTLDHKSSLKCQSFEIYTDFRDYFFYLKDE